MVTEWAVRESQIGHQTRFRVRVIARLGMWAGKDIRNEKRWVGAWVLSKSETCVSGRPLSAKVGGS